MVKKDNARAVVYFLCMFVSTVMAVVLTLCVIFDQKTDRYQSVHAPSTVPPMMGFSADSIMNTGDAKALEIFPGVGEVISQRMVEMREPLGGYRIPEDLLLVKGIGPKTMEKIMNALEEPLVVLPPARE